MSCGVLFIHSAPAALRPHIEWATGAGFGVPAQLHWENQPIEQGSYRAEYAYRNAAPGTAAKLASALQGWPRLRFEVTEDADAAVPGERYSYTPALGIFRADIATHGDVMVSEERIRKVLADAHAGRSDLETGIQNLLGKAWDDELEVFRSASDDSPVRWLNQPGRQVG